MVTTINDILWAVQDDYETRDYEATMTVVESLRVEVNNTRMTFDPIIYARTMAKRKRERELLSR